MCVRTTPGEIAFNVIFSEVKYLPYERTKPVTPLGNMSTESRKWSGTRTVLLPCRLVVLVHSRSRRRLLHKRLWYDALAWVWTKNQKNMLTFTTKSMLRHLLSSKVLNCQRASVQDPVQIDIHYLLTVRILSSCSKSFYQCFNIPCCPDFKSLEIMSSLILTCSTPQPPAIARTKATRSL